MVACEAFHVEGLTVEAELFEFIAGEALPGSGVDADTFWKGMAALIDDCGPLNRELLDRRDSFQAQIDAWHLRNREGGFDKGEYRAFLERIGYIEPAGENFTISTTGVDPEIASVSAPQLVVPVTNARFATNAANARWGSLYGALYGTDAMGDRSPAGPYDRERGARVMAWCSRFLDDVAPLADGAHGDAIGYWVEGGCPCLVVKPLGVVFRGFRVGAGVVGRGSGF